MTRDIERQLQSIVVRKDYGELRRVFSEHPQEARAARTFGGFNPLLFDAAIVMKDPVMTRIMLEGGADPGADARIKGPPGFTLLMSAIEQAVGIEMIELLLAFKAPPDARNVNGSTALHLAAVYNRLDAAKALVRAGCDIDACCNNGQTPLHRAVQGKYAGLAEFLLESGARYDIPWHSDATAQKEAARLEDPLLSNIFSRVIDGRNKRKIRRAAVKATAEPLRAAPKPVLRKTRRTP